MINEVAVAIIIFDLTIFRKVGFICKLKHYGVLVAIDLSSKRFSRFLKLLAARMMNGFNFINGSSFYFLDSTVQCGCLPEAPSSPTDMVDTQPKMVGPVTAKCFRLYFGVETYFLKCRIIILTFSFKLKHFLVS